MVVFKKCVWYLKWACGTTQGVFKYQWVWYLKRVCLNTRVLFKCGMSVCKRGMCGIKEGVWYLKRVCGI